MDGSVLVADGGSARVCREVGRDCSCAVAARWRGWVGGVFSLGGSLKAVRGLNLLFARRQVEKGGLGCWCWC